MLSGGTAARALGARDATRTGATTVAVAVATCTRVWSAQVVGRVAGDGPRSGMRAGRPEACGCTHTGARDVSRAARRQLQRLAGVRGVSA